MPRKTFTAEGLSAAGPYSHAVEADGTVYLSGQTPRDPATGKLAAGGIVEQTTQTFANISAVLKASGLTMDDVVQVNVFMSDLANFKAMNEVYEKQFTAPYPARTTVGVRELPMGSLIEIDMTARVPGPRN